MMNEQPMTCNRKSEGCLRLFGVNILPRKPITASHSQSLSHCHHKETISKDEDLFEELDHNNTIGKATRVGDFQFSRMVNLKYEEKENYENSKNHKDIYFDYLRNPEFIRSNMNVGRNSMMMPEPMMNWPLKENYKAGYFSDMFLQRRQSFPDKKNKGAFSYISSFFFTHQYLHNLIFYQ
ncbi:hypothetical protein V8G54_028513 [Vigna mungo]|uniref:Uncharacterized protein n=1 Tax=Vigna mungo TaxID=3915 RepID=A0AAQ3MS37_VIGMU